MDTELERLVWSRAARRCEYCRLPQFATEFLFHIEHIVALQHGGRTISANLALACPRCNSHKGPNLASVDLQTGRRVWLFHPRRHRWSVHFHWKSLMIVGRTSIGRATVRLLNMNDPKELERRRLLKNEGMFPPAEDALPLR